MPPIPTFLLLSTVSYSPSWPRRAGRCSWVGLGGLGGRLWLSGHSHFEFSPFGDLFVACLASHIYGGLLGFGYSLGLVWNCPCGDAMGSVYSPQGQPKT